MPRSARGTVPMPKADSTLFAHIAAELEGIAGPDLDRYAKNELDIVVGESTIRKAVRTAERLAHLPAPERAVRRWLALDIRALDFFQALVRLRMSAEDPRRRLGEIHGVVQTFAIENSADVVAVVIYERRSEQEALRSRLAEIADVLSWELVAAESHEPAIGTWRAQTKSAAQREHLTHRG